MLFRSREALKTVSESAHRMANEVFAFEMQIAKDESALADRIDEQHAQEKAIVGLEAQAARHEEELGRVGRRLQVVETERRRAVEEEHTAEQRRSEAAGAIAEYENQQRGAEDRLSGVMEHLHSRRDEAESRMRLVTDARTGQAGLSERVAGLEIEIRRLGEAAQELEERIQARGQDMERIEGRRTELRASIAETERQLDLDGLRLDELKQLVREADDAVIVRRDEFSSNEQEIRRSRQALEGVRAEVGHLEVTRATAGSDLAHLAASCLETLGTAIDGVLEEAERMEREGELAAPSKRLAAIAAADEDEAEEGAEDAPVPCDDAQGAPSDSRGVSEAPSELSSAEDVMADLRRKLERLGPVNMMAIEQFDELETRHTFLTSQRKDLLDAIAQTGEAIRKIEKTTRERFEEAFAAINANFEVTFTTLFGGGRAGLVLIDQENDAESGIDMIAQPPGKRLQNVQLLSGGEKALTAMALMFAIFKYRPSPFCLLDEIDAPLDDANIGRFVEMLRGMQGHTQFIIVTHSRKTMEIANRL